MSNKRRKKKKWAKKQRKAMRQKLQPQETNSQTPKPRKRKVNIKRRVRRKLSKMPLKLLALVAVVAFSLLFWAVSSSKEGVLANEVQEVAQTTSAQTGEVVIQRVAYRIAGQPVAVRVSGDPNPDNNGLFYLHTDHQGSIVAVSDEDGNPVEGISRFYPYGERRSGVSSEITDKGYTGQRHNDDLGLIYMNSRYYAPRIGRFISPDTFVPNPANPQLWNRYSYVNNNPVNYTDPSGHLLCKIGEGRCKNPLPPDLNVPLGTGIGFIDWIGRGTIQLGCTILLNGACEVQDSRLVSTSDLVYTENATSAVMGMVAPMGMVTMPTANASGRFIRKFAQPLMSKLDDFMVNTRWGATWRAMAEAAPDNMFVYQLDDNIAGALYVTRGQNATALQHTGGNEALNILALEVTSEAKGSGIGTELLRAAAQESIDLGYGGRIYGYAVDNETAQWLVNRGSQIIGEGRLFYFDEVATQALLNP